MNYHASKTFQCSVRSNERIIWISTYSGYRMFRADYKFEPTILSINVDDCTIGSVVTQSMRQSRWVLPRKRDGFTYPDGVEFDEHIDSKGDENYDISVKKIIKSHKYKNKGELFFGMRSCSVNQEEELITITPSIHVGKYAQWSFSDKLENVTIPSTSTAQEIGAAVRLGLSRCIV